MLDLVVETAIYEVIKRAGCDVASSEHLASQKVNGGAFVQNGHTFVIGSKGETKVKAKEHLMDKDKDDPLPEVQPREDQAKVEDIVKSQEGRFSHGMLDFRLEQVEDADALQINPYKSE